MPSATELVDTLSHPEMTLRDNAFTRFIDRTIITISEVFNWVWVVLLLVIIGNVILRYVFRKGMIELEELQWHLFAIGWLIGLSSTFILDGHVRVDILQDRFSYRKKLWFELAGLLLLFLPFVCFAFVYAIPFVELSWSTNERSTSANGLAARWFIKGFLLFSLFLLNLAGISRLIKVILSLTPGAPESANVPTS
ncbi:hypothetical protein AB833_08260 [Chromatiales bacterium (ex Bugula neritina AB1)]|nr:hypothetical protein AB833_08260 [Chromatiales bacterium (ex Bugula neritina AB1)]